MARVEANEDWRRIRVQRLLCGLLWVHCRGVFQEKAKAEMVKA